MRECPPPYPEDRAGDYDTALGAYSIAHLGKPREISLHPPDVVIDMSSCLWWWGLDPQKAAGARQSRSIAHNY